MTAPSEVLQSTGEQEYDFEHLPEREQLLTDLDTLTYEHLANFAIAPEVSREINSNFRLILSVAERLNAGLDIDGLDLHFHPNQLGYHRWEHTLNVARRTIQILPGYLLALRESGVMINKRAKEIQILLVGSLLHEIGYLLPRGESPYRTQGELSYDHVDLGIEYAQQILQRFNVVTDENQLVFYKHMHKATDFNTQWPQKQMEFGIERERERWARVLWAADFLSAFADLKNVPGYIRELFRENQARVVIEGKVKTFARDADGKLLLVNGKPDLIDAPDKGLDDYATILEAKYADTRIPLSPDQHEVNTQGLYEFVSSLFTLQLKPVLQKYIKYADKWFGDKPNQIEDNYRINSERIRLLQGAIAIRDTDPFAILEGAFTGKRLRDWELDLIRNGLLPSNFRLKNGIHWHDIDVRVLEGTKIHDNDEREQFAGPLSRLVTPELREILSAVTGDKGEAIRLLLERFRDTMRRESVGDVYLNLAPAAYLQRDGGPFETIDDSIAAFTYAFGHLKEDVSLPKLHFVMTVRRDKELKDDVSQRALASKINLAHALGVIAGVAFLGPETESLETYLPFFDELHGHIPLIMLVGQTFPGQMENLERTRQLMLTNLHIIAGLSRIKFQKMVLWGLHDLQYLSEKEIARLAAELPDTLWFIVTLTFDKIMKFVKNSADYAFFKLRKQRTQVAIARGNTALSAAGSVGLDVMDYTIGRSPD